MRQYHVQLDEGEIGGYVLLPGDPGRCELIASRLDGGRHVRSNREYTTWTGSLDGVAVSVTSTGIGGPSTAIAAEELIRLGAHTLVRVGTCGAMDPDLRFGDLVIAQAAVRNEGTSPQYAPLAFPAVADLDVVAALRDAARDNGRAHRIGVVVSSDAFYPEVDPPCSPVESELRARWDAWVRLRCLAAEMECSALFTIAALRGTRAGAILAVVNEAAGGAEAMPEARELPLPAMLDTAVASIRRLIAAGVSSPLTQQR
ncbi:MAG: nucleoside phosphorylase [Candidatus Dormibacteria bacterium]